MDIKFKNEIISYFLFRINSRAGIRQLAEAGRSRMTTNKIEIIRMISEAALAAKISSNL